MTDINCMAQLKLFMDLHAQICFYELVFLHYSNKAYLCIYISFANVSQTNNIELNYNFCRSTKNHCIVI